MNWALNHPITIFGGKLTQLPVSLTTAYVSSYISGGSAFTIYNNTASRAVYPVFIFVSTEANTRFTIEASSYQLIYANTRVGSYFTLTNFENIPYYPEMKSSYTIVNRGVSTTFRCMFMFLVWKDN